MSTGFHMPSMTVDEWCMVHNAPMRMDHQFSAPTLCMALEDARMDTPFNDTVGWCTYHGREAFPVISHLMNQRWVCEENDGTYGEHCIVAYEEVKTTILEKMLKLKLLTPTQAMVMADMLESRGNSKDADFVRSKLPNFNPMDEADAKLP